MLPAPRLSLSSSIAAGILVAVVVSTAVAIAAPQILPDVVKDVICGAGFILGLPLFVLLVNDLANLRRDRLLSEHAMLSPAVPEAQVPEAIERAVARTLQDEDLYEDEDDCEVEGDPPPRILFDYDAIADAQWRRWRGWRPWLVGIVGLTIATKIAFGPVWMAVAFYVLAPAVLREIYLVINALEAMTPAVWAGAPAWERVLARAYPGVLGAALVAALLTLVGVLLHEAATVDWNAARVLEAAGITFFCGWLAMVLASFALGMLALAWRREPPKPDGELPPRSFLPP